MRKLLNNQDGAMLVLIALLLPVFIGLAAISVDLGWLITGANEAANAADSGALGGASCIYGTDLPRPEMVQCLSPVAVATELVGLNRATVAEVQYGHWNGQAFTAQGFLNPPPALDGATIAGLLAEPDFINAVRVVARVDKTGFFIPATRTATREAIAACRLEEVADGVNIKPGSALVK